MVSKCGILLRWTFLIYDIFITTKIYIIWTYISNLGRNLWLELAGKLLEYFVHCCISRLVGVSWICSKGSRGDGHNLLSLLEVLSHDVLVRFSTTFSASFPSLSSVTPRKQTTNLPLQKFKKTFSSKCMTLKIDGKHCRSRWDGGLTMSQLIWIYSVC